MATAPRPNFPSYWTVRERAGAFADAGSYSCGGFIWFMSPGVATGIIFYTAKAGAHTIRASLFNPAGVRVATVDVACAGPGTYTGTFAAPYEVTEADVQSQTQAWNGAFAVQMWETSGAHHTQSARGGLYYDDKGMWAFHPTVNYYRQAGDVWIGNSNTTNVYAPIDIVGYGLGEEAIFTTPFLVQRSPAPDSTRNPKDTELIFAIVEQRGSVVPSTIRIYIGGPLAYNGLTAAFLPPFNSAQSAFEKGTYDGYDGYKLTFVRTSDYPSYRLVKVRAEAENLQGNKIDGYDGYFEFRIADYEPPMFSHLEPEPDSVGVGRQAVVRASVHDVGSGVNPNSVMVRIMGRLAYDGYNFLVPFDGVGSAFDPTIVDGYDGYRVSVAINGSYPSHRLVEVKVMAEDNENSEEP